MALPFSGIDRDSVSTIQRPEAKKDRGWVSGTVIWPPTDSPPEMQFIWGT